MYYLVLNASHCRMPCGDSTVDKRRKSVAGPSVIYTIFTSTWYALPIMHLVNCGSDAIMIHDLLTTLPRR